MGWTKTEWSCGHEGEMQLYGKNTKRASRVAWEAGRKCMACWLTEEWEKGGDDRAKREDRFELAKDIAKGLKVGGQIHLPEHLQKKEAT